MDPIDADLIVGELPLASIPLLGWKWPTTRVGTAVQLWRDKLYPLVMLGATRVALGIRFLWRHPLEFG